MSSKTLGIVGGMGPLATAMLFEKVATLTRVSKDQDHIRVLIDSNPGIPDRTAHIVAGGEDPRPELTATATHLEAMGADFLIMPCNTAHYFYEDITKGLSIPFLHMVNETAAYIGTHYPDTRHVGVLATEGTCKAGVYTKALSTNGLTPLMPDPAMQQHVTDLIYGIKAGETVPIDGFMEAVAALKAQGATCFVLGCTELSVAQKLYGFSGPFVDPLTVIAEAAIRFAGKHTISAGDKMK
ncbi:aspartate/glutamate racemase family protein [Desulfoluna butyratoxydans]|uniref:Aspartate racemase n=1 Tax=Desulfoluna butyratoxydans TaxID=231438 RepID=A0A4U8YNN2_9BACT|nr:amino acid racemase [Desulfoluna butyratoxydans]VFQ45234.1 aspartate racemase [Desulfoluna butyratoxydans]